jgi:hypothetical protein
VGILLATYDTDPDRLAGSLRHHLIAGDRGRQEDGLAGRLIVRRLEPHHLPSALLIHIIQQLIEEAKRRLYARFGGIARFQARFRGRPAEARKAEVRLQGRIRLVIDDWSTILSTYPEVQRDPLVLPFLTGYLRREGVTTLILATRPGNPQDRGTGPIEQEARELRVMADHRLYTWHVAFFDERRVALTVQPSPPGAGVQVRELRPGRVSELTRQRLSELPPASVPPAPPAARSDRAKDDEAERFDDEAVVVDPHFELYSGLQEGQPVPVPLEVRLFAERQDIPSFQAYLAELQYLLGHLFRPDGGRTVLRPQYGTDYDTLRELSYLQSEARLDHTLVLQVDEFWAESRSELRRQERYLLARTVDRDGTPVKAEDPFGLFQRSDAVAAQIRTERQRAGLPPAPGPRRRLDFFDLLGYDGRRAAERFAVDKVPYAWDFGFLVCDGIAWARAFNEQDHRTRRWSPRDRKWVNQRVGDVWRRLWKITTQPFDLPPELNVPEAEDGEAAALDADRGPRALWLEYVADTQNGKTSHRWIEHIGEPPDEDDPDDDDRVQAEPVSWREFLGACKVIAKATRYEFQPFDVDLMATESFSCLVLEVWFSEVYQAWELVRGRANDGDVGRLRADPDWWPRARREDGYSVPLTRLLGDDREGYGGLFRRALYRAMLLLDEMFGQGQLSDRNLVLEPRPASPKAAAARHWYSTAALAMKGGPDSRRQHVAGLPGHYTVRGDWFLAVARGSRSPRLGERAMDILCSRRANITRLQTGLGLPVRDLLGAGRPAHAELRTEYWTSLPYVGDDHVQQQIPYKELRKLGAFDEADGLGRNRNFHWLWRSTIRQYDVHARMWQKWLDLLFKHWRTWPTPKAPDVGRVGRDQGGRPWWDGFAEYDYCLRCEVGTLPDRPRLPCHVQGSGGGADEDVNERWEEFNEYCDSLVEGLRRASLTPESDAAAAPPD